MDSNPCAIPDCGDDAGAAVLDAAALAHLASLDPKGKSGLVRRVLKAYLTSLMRMLQQLTLARQSNDIALTAHVAHTLKSSSASVGARQMASLCAQIEQEIRERTMVDVTASVELLHAEGDRVAKAVAIELDRA